MCLLNPYELVPEAERQRIGPVSPPLRVVLAAAAAILVLVAAPARPVGGAGTRARASGDVYTVVQTFPSISATRHGLEMDGSPAIDRPGSTPVESAAPVFRKDFPDPAVIAFRGMYYAYGTQTSWEPRPRAIPILESRDRLNWRYVADAFARPPAWVRRQMWAPSVLPATLGGRPAFILYYSAMSRRLGVHCLAAATSGSPLGPFMDRGPIACGDTTGRGYIDPAPLVFRGSTYLYFSVDAPRHSISVIPLASDLIHPAGPRRELFGVSQAWERGGGGGTVEAPNPLALGSRVVLLYSGNSWRGGSYAVGQAVSSDPLGGFSKSSQNPILSGSGQGLVGPGSSSVFVDASGQAYLTYHGWTGGARALYMTELNDVGGVLHPAWGE